MKPSVVLFGDISPFLKPAPRRPRPHLGADPAVVRGVARPDRVSIRAAHHDRRHDRIRYRVNRASSLATTTVPICKLTVVSPVTWKHRPAHARAKPWPALIIITASACRVKLCFLKVYTRAIWVCKGKT